MNTSTLESRLRQIAILVASVDTTAARQLLMHLPTEIAKRVRALAADIGPVPPEERRALLAEFQKSQAQSPIQAKENNSLTDSANNHQGITATAFADFDTPASVANPITESPSPAWTSLGVDALVRLVRLERPTVIAVVLQQLPATQIAAVLQRLSRSTAKETLRALGSLQDIDDVAMREIDAHLSERLRDYHHKIESELEQTRRMNELLNAAPPEMRQLWASWMRPVDVPEDDAFDYGPSATAFAVNTLDNLYKNASVTTSDTPTVAESGQIAQPAQQASAKAVMQKPVAADIQPATIPSSPTDATSRRRDEDADVPNILPFSAGSSPVNAHSASMADRELLRRNMERLLTLAAEDLANLLSSLDGHTILLALAGASTRFMTKFRGMLEPDDAKALDLRIQQIGPITLRHIDEAQQRLFDAYVAFDNSSIRRRAA